MTNDRFDRRLPELLDELAGSGRPDYIDDLVRRTANMRQRSAWAFPERWLPMAVTSRRSVFTPVISWRSLGVFALLALMVAAAVAVYIASQRPSGSAVSTYRGNAARTGEMPGPGPTGTPRIVWQLQAAGPFESSAAVANGVIYVVSGDGIAHAVALATGAELWSTNLGAQASASALVIDGQVIVGDKAGVVHALTIGDGKLAWTTETDGPITSSAATDGRLVIVATNAGSLYALEPRSGSQIWRQANLGVGVTRSGAIANGTTYQGFGGSIVAVATADGSVTWRRDLATDGQVGTPTVSGGLVFAATGIDARDPAARAVVALDGRTGKTRWLYQSPSGSLVYTPAVAGNRAYVVGYDYLLVSLDAVSGQQIWSHTRPSQVEAAPAISGGVLYVAGKGGPMEAIDASNGATIWSVPIEGIPYGPVVVDGYVLVGSNNGTLYAIGGSR